MSEGVDFRSVLEASANCYMLLDRDLRYVWANAAYLGITGCPLEQLIGRGLFEVFPHDPADPDNESSALLRRSLEKVLATRERDVLACIPYRVPRSPGGSLEERLWSATHTPLLRPDGEVELVLQHTVEVTELARLREAAEPEMFSAEAGVLGRAELVQRANRNLDTQLGDLRRMFDQAPGFFCFLRGPEHVFEIANGAYLQIIGKRDLIGRRLRDALPELDGQGFPELLDRVYRTGEPFVGRGIRVCFAGTPQAEAFEIIVDFVYQPIADASGRVFGIFVQGNDITVQKQLEAEREQLLAREQAARAEAERANQLKDEFLATVGHELRTPLNAMLGWVQLLRAGKLTEERRQRALEIVERNARAQAEIINDILDVSRIMSGKLRLESERLDAMAVVESAVESARPSAHAKGIHLSAELEGAAEVIGDAVRLQQAVGNVLANAVKFTPAGGSVAVRARAAGNELQVVVSDTGRGVAPESCRTSSSASARPRAPSRASTAASAWASPSSRRSSGCTAGGSPPTAPVRIAVRGSLCTCRRRGAVPTPSLRRWRRRAPPPPGVRRSSSAAGSWSSTTSRTRGTWCGRCSRNAASRSSSPATSRRR